MQPDRWGWWGLTGKELFQVHLLPLLGLHVQHQEPWDKKQGRGQGRGQEWRWRPAGEAGSHP